jgi:hypothetical protein
MPRDIRIQPNKSTTGSTQQPTIFFSGTTAASINLKVEDDGSLTFEGNNGGLFNITDSKDGLLSSVNDVSGLPIFAVYSSDKIIAGGYNQNALVVDNDKTFIGTNTISVPTGTKLSVSGNTLVYGSLTSNNMITGGTFVGSTLTLNRQVGPISITGFTASGGGSVTGLTYSNNTITLTQSAGSQQSVNISTMTGLTISGLGQNILTVVGSGSTSSSPIFRVQGSSGELFSVTDSLVGSLFSVNDISGLPILEVFSDNTTLMGSYLAPSLNTTVRTTANSGTTTIYSIPTSAYTGGYFDYNVLSATGARSGNIISIWSGNTVNYTEYTTVDIGNTTPITFNMTVTSGLALLRVSATTNSWIVKTIVRSI